MDIITLITHPLAMLIYGLLSHFLKDLMRLSSDGERIGVIDYWKRFPYQSLIAVIGAVAGFAALVETNQLNGLTAFGIGYMANSVADAIGKRSLNRIENS